MAIPRLAAAAPFRHMVTPGGHAMSVATTNCGRLGWVTDRAGYRYETIDPMTRRPWPSLPAIFQRVATRAAAAGGFAGFEPDACLINRYEPGARLSMHQDRNERDFGAPIVSVSLGLPAVFLFGGSRRHDRPRRVRLESGDVVVWACAARLPRDRAARRWTPSAHRSSPDQSDVPQGRLTVTSRQRLLNRLDEAWVAFKDSYAGVSDPQLTEAGVTGDWSVKDILAHVTTWEEEALKYLPLILESGRPPRYVKYGGIDAFNAAMTERKRGLSVSEVLRQLDDTHRRLVDFVQGVPEAEFVGETRFRRRLRLDTYHHYPGHAETIRTWRGRRSAE